MFKRVLSVLLCAVLLLPCFAGCGKDEDDHGAYITMYLAADSFDFDPINAFYNADTRNIVSLMFDTLFKLNEKGKIEKSLAKSYTIHDDDEENEHWMDITLKDNCWSNGTPISAEDVVFAWKRLLRSTNSYEAASLLFDVKNARAVKNDDASVDDIGVEAIEDKVVRVTFEGKIDYDQFLMNLTSIATAPLLESYVAKNEDWAKKASTITTSGAYKLGKIAYVNSGTTVKDSHAMKEGATEFVTETSVGKIVSYFYLERNPYYNRNVKKDKEEKAVKNYRILVDCSMTAEEILAEYQAGHIFYMGNIPMSLREDETIAADVKVSNALSTFVLAMNENAKIGGETLFANEAVRKALSLAIDREAIAEAVVYAEAATGLVAPGVLEGKAGTDEFRANANSEKALGTSSNMEEARAVLKEAKIFASKYSFSIKVASYDEVHCKMVEMIAASWKELGFNVTVNKVGAIQNNDYFKEEEEVTKDVCDDQFLESIQYEDYEVIAYDYNAFTADAYSMLANFAVPFAGTALDMDNNGKVLPNFTGYNSEDYNDLMEAIYYLPYFKNLTFDSSDFLGIYATKADYQKTYRNVMMVYNQYRITPSDDADVWAEQRAKLLHKAEELLLADLPVIPVVFNQNATLSSKELTKISADYYVPSLFQTAKLKNYKDYSYVWEKISADGEESTEEVVSVFEDFPFTVDEFGMTAWDYMAEGRKVTQKKK